MAIDRQKIGLFAGDFMDVIEENINPEDLEKIEIGNLLFIAEIQHPGDEDDPEDRGHTGILYHCDDERGWVQMGILRAATLGVEEA
jgi:hypothetical protein